MLGLVASLLNVVEVLLLESDGLLQVLSFVEAFERVELLDVQVARRLLQALEPPTLDLSIPEHKGELALVFLKEGLRTEIPGLPPHQHLNRICVAEAVESDARQVFLRDGRRG